MEPHSFTSDDLPGPPAPREPAQDAAQRPRVTVDPSQYAAPGRRGFLPGNPGKPKGATDTKPRARNMVHESGLIGESRPRRHHTTGGRVIGAVSPQTAPRVDPAAYHGGEPGRPFVQANPGRPRGAVDRVPREPRGWRGALPKMYARLVRFDPVNGRRVLLDPETAEPAIRDNGEMIYDPSEIDLFGAALYYGLQDPKYAPHFMQFWFKFSYLETPGKPKGADTKPRAPRDWKDFMAKAYAGLVGFDTKTRKVVLIDPETHEPQFDEHGNVINPTYVDVAAEALFRGLQGPTHSYSS